MKAVCKKLFSLMLAAILLVSAVPFQALAAEGDAATAPTAETQSSETTAADLTAAAPAANLQSTEPAAYSGVEFEPEVVYVHFQLGKITGEEERDLIGEGKNLLVKAAVKTKVGNKVGAPSGANALTTLAKALGSSANYEFVKWYDKNGQTFSNSNYLTEDMISDSDDEGNPVIDIYAEFKEKETNIKLNANGGKISATTHPVKIGQSYSAKVALPTPTKANCEFLGWYKADGTLVEDESIVTDLGTLTAKWSEAVLKVIYQVYLNADGTTAYGDDGGWTEAMTADARANTTLSSSDGRFPTSYQINQTGEYLSDEMREQGWKITGWVVRKNDAKVVDGTTKVNDSMIEYDTEGNPVIYIRPVYQRTITLYKNDNGHATRSATVTLGAPIPALPYPGDYANHAFLGWTTEDGTMMVPYDELSSASKHPAYFPGMGDLYASWDEAVRVLLYVHVDGNVKDAEATKMYYDVPSTGFDLSRIDMYKIFPKYGKYDDTGDKSYGWYNIPQWANYVVGKPATEFEYVTAEQLEKQNFREYHIMLIDNGNNSSSSSSGSNNYNTNHSTADKTNPTTGDQILIAVTVMAVTACALVFFLLKKKRASK